jgi:hypothetical protein
MRRARRFLPEPLTVLHYLVDQLQGFSSREDVGIETGLIDRMIRAFIGDPITETSLTSTGTSNVIGLPNTADALSAIIHVSGADIYYRVDGLPPNAAGDNLVQAGSIITLTGQRTLTAFQFCSAIGSSATLYVTFYT